MYLGRAHSLGHARQHVDVLGWALLVSLLNAGPPKSRIRFHLLPKRGPRGALGQSTFAWIRRARLDGRVHGAGGSPRGAGARHRYTLRPMRES